MADEQKFNVEKARRGEIEEICLSLEKAIKTAPSLKEQNQILKVMQTGIIPFEDVSKIPGVVVFNDPHTYGMALMILARMFPGQRKKAEEAFNHELDHFNEARSSGVSKGVLGITFGVKEVRTEPNGSLKIIQGSWSGFIASLLPEGLTDEEKRRVDLRIAHAPQKLSNWDRKKLGRLR